MTARPPRSGRRSPSSSATSGSPARPQGNQRRRRARGRPRPPRRRRRRQARRKRRNRRLPPPSRQGRRSTSAPSLNDAGVRTSLHPRAGPVSAPAHVRGGTITPAGAAQGQPDAQPQRFPPEEHHPPHLDGRPAALPVLPTPPPFVQAPSPEHPPPH